MPAVAVPMAGVPGGTGALGVTEFDAADSAPVPNWFTAATRKVYAVPLVSPVKRRLVAPAAAVRVIGAPVAGVAVTWAAPTTGGAPTGYTVQARDAGNVVRGSVTVGPALRTATVAGLNNNTTYRLRVQANGTPTNGPFSANSNAVTTPNVPNAPVIGTAVAGAAGGAITATANWAGATNNGGRAITGYRVSALRISAAGAVVATTQSAVLGAAVRNVQMTLPVAGNYRFTVVAINAVGTGPASARSNLVAGR